MAVNDEIFKNLAQYGGGTINERVYNFLGSLGYTGTINDRLGQFEEGGRKGWQGLIRAWGQYTPAQVFSQGQQGVWYEPKPIVAGQQVLYQDAAGTTPVAADGDPVGLMLDRSRGLVKGPEVYEIGAEGFDSLSGIVGRNASVTLSGTGVLITATSVSPSTSRGEFSISGLTVGKTYQIEIDWVSIQNSGNQGPLLWTATDTPSATNDPGALRCRVTATDTSGLIRMYSGSSSENVEGDAVRVDRISIKELPGNHATQPTSAARPIYRTNGVLHWLEGDGVDDKMLFSLPGLAGKPSATVCIAAEDVGSQSLGAMIGNATDVAGTPGDMLLWVPRTDTSWAFRGNWGGTNADSQFNHPAGTAVVTGQYWYNGTSPGLVVRSQGANVAQLTGNASSGVRGGDFDLFDRGTGANAHAAFFGGIVVEGIPSPAPLESYLATLAGVQL